MPKPTSLALIPTPGHSHRALRAMSLEDAPDYVTAIAAGIAHGFTPEQSLASSYMKWATDHADSVQSLGLGNFYNGPKAFRQFMDLKRHIQFLVVVVAEQGRQIAALKNERQPRKRIRRKARA